MNKRNTLVGPQLQRVEERLHSGLEKIHSLRGCDRVGSGRGYTNAGEQLSFSSRFWV